MVSLMKMTSTGNIEWEKTFGSGFGSSVRQTADGGYILTGTTYSPANSIILVKTNAAGDSQWTRTYSKFSNNNGASVKQTSDGGYIVTGKSNGSIILIRTDSFGNWD